MFIVWLASPDSRFDRLLCFNITFYDVVNFRDLARYLPVKERGVGRTSKRSLEILSPTSALDIYTFSDRGRLALLLEKEAAG